MRRFISLFKKLINVPCVEIHEVLVAEVPDRKVVLFYPLDNIIVDIQLHICNGMQRYVSDWLRSKEVLSEIVSLSA